MSIYNTPLEERFGEKLEELREGKNMTREQLAEQVGLTARHIAALERGERRPTLNTMEKLLRTQFPDLASKYVRQFALLFLDLQKKCDSAEISTKALDLRGLLAALHLIEKGIPSGQALALGIINKAFEPFERQLVADAVWSRIPQDATRAQLFTA